MEDKNNRAKEICKIINDNSDTIDILKKGKVIIDFAGRSTKFKVKAFPINGKIKNDQDDRDR